MSNCFRTLHCRERKRMSSTTTAKWRITKKFFICFLKSRTVPGGTKKVSLQLRTVEQLSNRNLELFSKENFQMTDRRLTEATEVCFPAT